MPSDALMKRAVHQTRGGGSGGTLESSAGAGPSIDSVSAALGLLNECRLRSRCCSRSRSMNCSRRRCRRSVRSRKSRYLRGICPITVMSPCHEFIAEDCATCSVLVRDSLCAMHTSGGWRIASERPSEIRRLGFAARSRSPAGQSERIAPLVKTSGCHRGWRPERGLANCLPARPHAPSSQRWPGGAPPSCSARSPAAPLPRAV